MAPRVRQHRSSRRVPPPKDSDFDHEISLVDNSAPLQPNSDQEDVLDGRVSRATGETVAGPSSDSQRKPPDTDSVATLDELNGVAGGGSQDGILVGRQEESGPSVNVEQPTPHANEDLSKSRPKPKSKTPESEIDILYENQRGGFLCGMPLFSSGALGNLDPPAWTNRAHRPSPTNIHTAQVPDPSWEWAWPEWRINHDDGVDEDGWEYSFMFYKRFSWHKARWWNSFVRRRAWIRKRVKKSAGYTSQDPHMLNPEYFSIRPSAEMDRSPSRGGAASTRGSRISTSTAGAPTEPPPIIENANELLRVLRASRIDREKIEAVDSYLDNAEDDIEGLHEVMHEVMALFVFQASRRALLTRLTDVHDHAVEQLQRAKKKKKEKEKDSNSIGDRDMEELERRVENLAAAIKHADEEVRRLEYWSDVKGMVAEGESKGAVDKSQGWDPGWQGLDRSGPAMPRPETQETKEANTQDGDADGNAFPKPDLKISSGSS